MARATSCQNSLQAENPRIAAAVRPTDAATRRPVPQRRTSLAVARLEAIVHALMSMLSALCAATGAPSSGYMTGHAEPSSESGRPSETNVR